METMKAAVYAKFGDPEVISIVNVQKPKPKDNEILVRVACTTVTIADSRIRARRFPRGFGTIGKLVFGIQKPRTKILGSHFSGVVEEVGKNVSTFKIGNAVCGSTGFRMGSHAEYIVVNATGAVVMKPRAVSHADAVGVLFGGSAALYFLRDRAHVSPGERVLINGASGAVGTNAVQLARYFGGNVSAVTRTESSELMQSLGVETVIDYIREDILARNETYDVVLDTVGTLSPQSGKKLLTPTGRLVLMVASLSEMLKRDKKIITGVAPERARDMTFLLSLVENGTLKVLIDSTFTLETIGDAHARVDMGQKIGNVIVSIDGVSG